MPDPRELYWSDPERVERFAGREPDQRLVELIGDYPNPAAVRVLDLGCAGGRNTRLLVERGFNTMAVDIAGAMVERTRGRVLGLCGVLEAERRVRIGPMDDLRWAADASFDLIVALGIYQQAADEAEWGRALAETARVLKPAGRVLAAVFSPGTILQGERFERVAGTRFVHRHPGGETMCFVEPDELDAEMAQHHLHPVVATERIVKTDGDDRRVTANGLYLKHRRRDS